MPASTLTARELGRATLARQMLLAREAVAAVDAVERLGGLQAQEPKPPFAGLWSRVDGFRGEDLRAALHDRRVVRATLMRATLHLVSAGDYGTLRGALEPVMAQFLRTRTKALDVDRVVAEARALYEEEPRTFGELRALLAAKFPGDDERALGAVARTRLPLVMVPTDDRWAFARDSRFALADGWLGEPTPADEPTPEPLVLRYLAAYGPAAATDVQNWSGLKGMKPVLEGLRDRLATFKDERGRELFDLPDAPRPGGDVPAPARLLPEFDSLVLAHDDRTRVIADEHRALITTKNLRIRATFLHDGLVRGTWTVERKGAKATLRLAPFERLPKRAVGELRDEAESMLRFVEEDAGSFDVRVDPAA